MKINKNTIIIVIVIIVAVAAYLLWKHEKTNGATSGTADVPSRLDQVITGAGLTSIEADIVRNFKPSDAYKDWLIQCALERGIDYESQCVLSALWNNFHDPETGEFRSETLKNRYTTIYNKVIAMNH